MYSDMEEGDLVHAHKLEKILVGFFLFCFNTGNKSNLDAAIGIGNLFHGQGWGRRVAQTLTRSSNMGKGILGDTRNLGGK